MKTANVEYFYTKCNQVLGTNYTVNDWGGIGNIKKSINIEWLVAATQKVYQKIHNPKSGCRLLLSTRFNPTGSKLVLNEEVVNSIVDYLSKLNKPCDNDCACAIDRNCNCVCSSTCASNCGYLGNCVDSGGTCTCLSSECTCNYACTIAACACNCNCNCASTDCGSNTECQCDCDPYDCNCDLVPNCAQIPARPMSQNCVCDQGSNCPCACECYTPPPSQCGGNTCGDCTDCTGGGGDNTCSDCPDCTCDCNKSIDCNCDCTCQCISNTGSAPPGPCSVCKTDTCPRGGGSNCTCDGGGDECSGDDSSNCDCSGGGGGGGGCCLPYGTLIEMKNGWKKIETIQKGDVLSTGAIISQTYYTINTLYKVITAKHTFKMTSDHHLQTSVGISAINPEDTKCFGVKPLKVGMKLLTTDGFEIIQNIIKTEEICKVAEIYTNGPKNRYKTKDGLISITLTQKMIDTFGLLYPAYVKKFNLETHPISYFTALCQCIYIFWLAFKIK